MMRFLSALATESGMPCQFFSLNDKKLEKGVKVDRTGAKGGAEALRKACRGAKVKCGGKEGSKVSGKSFVHVRCSD